uniref:Uncharacterized protein n=1 Tax=Steinernema glaseri TaxID=37863 RepID=A0A1I7Y8V3_9BILA
MTSSAILRLLVFSASLLLVTASLNRLYRGAQLDIKLTIKTANCSYPHAFKNGIALSLGHVNSSNTLLYYGSSPKLKNLRDFQANQLFEELTIKTANCSYPHAFQDGVALTLGHVDQNDALLYHGSSPKLKNLRDFQANQLFEETISFSPGELDPIEEVCAKRGKTPGFNFFYEKCMMLNMIHVESYNWDALYWKPEWIEVRQFYRLPNGKMETFFTHWTGGDCDSNLVKAPGSSYIRLDRETEQKYLPSSPKLEKGIKFP